MSALLLQFLTYHFYFTGWPVKIQDVRIDILTLFPGMFEGPFDQSIIKRAQEKGLVEIKIHDLRQWATDKHKTVDDHPYGGGVGMLMMVEPIYRALQALKLKIKNEKLKIILMDPAGIPFNQLKAQELSKLDNLVLIAGHYEGVDARVKEHLIDEEISIGDYILTGGELPAMVMVDAIVRLIPGVLEKPEATQLESFQENLLEAPQYTRPEEFKGWKVPEVLLSGNHKEIEKWKKEKALEKTKKQRPDLLK
ncbi:tRNA (guanosine(37)-N1)-methyltransferase TrmD [Candidatus Microgenomates bacterium]|nr:tRNA (guanosine(37)-N1)-methyltransferase TrmD [Candidatus Microgenomates bacterium]